MIGMLELRNWTGAATLACVTALAGLGSATQADATTVASLDLTNGTYAVTTPGTTLGAASTVNITGDWAASLFAGLIPIGDQAYQLSASFSLDGIELFGGSIIETFDLSVFLPDINDIVSDLIAGVGTPILIPPAVAVYGGTGTATGSGTFEGDFFVNVDTFVPFGMLMDGVFADLDPNGILVPSGFLFPDNADGTFSASFAIAAVPLPATLPLLAAGGVMLLGIGRRRRKNAV